MFTVNSYLLAVIFCIVTMICWGSWGNTQKLVSKNWRYELFYWDYVIGMVLFTILLGFTMGSHGDTGRSFLEDLGQASGDSIGWVILGGVIFNASNILLSASISLAGMSVAFPLGVGVALIVIAIICNGVASGKMQKGEESRKNNKKGIIIALIAGVLMSLFYRFVVKGMDVENFNSPAIGMMTPYSAIFVFSIGVLLSNFVFNTLVMKYPFVGEKVSYSEYFKGNTKTHICGMLGGAIWGLGSAFSYIASGEAGPAVSYALGQGAPLIAAIWGVFIWKEFKGSTKSVNQLLALMFIFFLVGLGMIVVAGN